MNTTRKPARHRRRVARWTLARKLADRIFPQVVPGRHHDFWRGLSWTRS